MFHRATPVPSYEITKGIVVKRDRRKSACPSAQQCCGNLLRSYEGSNYTLHAS